MRNKGLIVLAALAVAALVTAGIAIATVKVGGVEGVSATLNATTVVKSVQKSCTVNGGDTYTYTRATYSGTAASSEARLNGPFVVHAQSMIDDTTGVGAVIGDFRVRGPGHPDAYGRIEASVSGGQLSGSVRGHAEKPWGELFAGINGAFTASGGFASDNLGSGSGTDSGVILQHGACVRTIYLH
ncbi:MAG TPA: hypothetical protein VGH79_01265 [Gaiellaceae bacterium]|jgi:hypothetical protein